MGMFDFVSDPVASLVSSAASFFGTQSTNQANIDQANANNAWSAQQYATRYQTQVKDLEAAGLNPMLAYTQSPGQAPTAQPVTLQNPYHSAAQTFNESLGARGRYQHDVASAGQAEKMQRQIEATTDHVRQQIEKLKGDTNFATQQDILKQTAWSLQQAGVRSQEQGMSEGQQRAVWAATIKNLEKDGVLKKLDIDAAEALGNLGRQSKELQPVINVLIRLLGK